MFKLSQFGYDEKGKSLFAEASELRIPVGGMRDSIQVKSDKTGRVITFHFAKTEGDQYVLYRPLVKSPIKEVCIWND